MGLGAAREVRRSDSGIDGSGGLGKDDDRHAALEAVRLGVCGCRRLPFGWKRGKDAEWDSADGCGPGALAGDVTRDDRGVDSGWEECRPGMFGAEGRVSGRVAGWAGGAFRVP